jgi:CubicO group peptidase (beta-lactamase class C family)
MALRTFALAIGVCATLALPAAGAEDSRIKAFESGLRPAVEVDGAPPVRWTLAERMAYWHVPGVSIAVIRHGRLAWAKGYGVRQVGAPAPVDPQTVFSVGSISKVGTAVMSLRLAEAGKVDLDRDVNTYLRRWRVPQSVYTDIAPVTLRGLMSHSSGLNVWGFPDFQPGQPLPTILDTLDGQRPSKTPAVRAEYVPGTQSRYSGGGVEVEQLLIEDVTGMSFKDAARTYLLAPLGMGRSTYEQPLPATYENVAKAHDAQGRPTALPRGWESMPETAASGLWTTPSDLAKMLIALMAAYQGRPNELLSRHAAQEMMTEVGPSTAGLGPFLDGRGMTRRFSHAGSNDSYKAWIEGHLATGDGLIIFTNGASDGDLRGEIRSAIAAAEGWAPAFQRTRVIPHVEVAPSELPRLAGTYQATIGAGPIPRRAAIALTLAGYKLSNDAIAFSITTKDGQLYLSAPGDNHRVRLLAEDHSHFVPETRSEISLEFARGYDGRIGDLVVRINDAVLTAHRIG